MLLIQIYFYFYVRASRKWNSLFFVSVNYYCFHCMLIYYYCIIVFYFRGYQSFISKLSCWNLASKVSSWEIKIVFCVLKQSNRAVFSSLNWLKELFVHATNIALIFNLTFAMCSVLQWGLEYLSNETCRCHSINHSFRNEFLGDEVEIHSAVIKAGRWNLREKDWKYEIFQVSVRILAGTHRCWLTCEDYFKSPALSHALRCLSVQKVPCPTPACGCNALAL